MDWTTYIPSVVTGVVGLAGIGGALWQAKRAREAAAEDAKANRQAASSDLQVSMRQTANNLVVSINAEISVLTLRKGGESMRHVSQLFNKG